MSEFHSLIGPGPWAFPEGLDDDSDVLARLCSNGYIKGLSVGTEPREESFYIVRDKRVQKTLNERFPVLYEIPTVDEEQEYRENFWRRYTTTYCPGSYTYAIDRSIWGRHGAHQFNCQVCGKDVAVARNGRISVHKLPVPEATVKHWVEMYNSGMTPSEIGEKEGFTAKFIYDHIRYHPDYKPRKPGRPRMK